MSGGVQLAPNGWAALSVLGLAQDVLSRATRLHEITVRSLTNSATLARLPLKDVYASVARADLATVFKQKIEHLTGFANNTTVEQTSLINDGVTIIGKDAGLYHVAGLVAADGVAGFGRTFISGQSEAAIRASLATDKVALRSTINLSDLPNFFCQAISNLWLGDGVHIVHYPIGDSLNIVATMPKTLATANGKSGCSDTTHHCNSLLIQRSNGHQRLCPDQATASAGDAVQWCLLVMPPMSCHHIWHRGQVKACRMRHV